MASVIKLKRTSTASSVPSTSDLELGELALNTNDGKLFFKKDDGTTSIQEIVPFNPAAVTQDIVPATNETVNLGTADKRFGELFLAGNTINIGGATISSDGSGQIQISANGAVLPAGSKVSSGTVTQEIATVATTATDTDGNERQLGLNNQVASVNVPFFTKADGLSTRNATFTFKQNINDARVFQNFTLANGDSISTGIALFSF